MWPTFHVVVVLYQILCHFGWKLIARIKCTWFWQWPNIKYYSQNKVLDDQYQNDNLIMVDSSMSLGFLQVVNFQVALWKEYGTSSWYDPLIWVSLSPYIYPALMAVGWCLMHLWWYVPYFNSGLLVPLSSTFWPWADPYTHNADLHSVCHMATTPGRYDLLKYGNNISMVYCSLSLSHWY